VAGGLKGSAAKWERAHSQIDKLQAEVWDVWPPTKAWPVSAEEDRGGLEYRFYLGELPSIDPEWLLWTGEILFDLRSTLDHLIYQLHIRRWRDSIPRDAKVKGVNKDKPIDVETSGQFPICNSLQAWRSSYYRIATLSKRDRRTINDLQPYVTRNDSRSLDRRWLLDLDTIHNIDKHRRLHPVNSAHGAAVIPDFPPETGFQMHPEWGPVESKSHIDTWTFAKAPAKMCKHQGAFIAPALEYGGRTVELIPFLKELMATVGRVLLIFESRYPGMSRHR
jgi:hypothetical protein